MNNELESIIHYNKGLSDRLERTRDRMVFQCLTGLRYDDMIQLSKKDYTDSGYLRLIQRKNKKRYNLPLLPEAKRIFLKYDYKLPYIHINNQNEYVKDLLKELKISRSYEYISYPGGKEKREERNINDYFSTHDCIHTFITLAIQKGILPKTLETIIGKDAKTIIDHYYGQSQEDLTKDLEKLLK